MGIGAALAAAAVVIAVLWLPLGRVTEKPGPTPAPEMTATPTLQTRTITMTDEQVVPYLPIEGTWVHFLPGSKVRVGYKALAWRVDIGVEEGRLWIDNVPPWIDLAAIDKDAARYSARENGRIWLVATPSWLDISRFDKDVTGLPYIVGVQTDDGRITITYLP